jgi:site-specific recombinase XerC
MLALLEAPLRPLAAKKKKTRGKPVSASICYRDVAVLETIYSCGLRVSELCGLCADDIDWNSQLVRVRGKGKRNGSCRSASRR